MAKTSSRPQVLVIDDIPEFLREMKIVLTAAGMEVITCPSPNRAIRMVSREHIDLVITTLMMREMGGFDVIRAIRAGGNSTPIMMITGYGSSEAAIEATRLGASDYLDKPVNPSELIARVRKIVERSHERQSSRGAKPDLAADLVTQDPAMKSLLETVRILATTNSRVLIMGETGTGKQVIARAIHNASERKNLPFIDINCAAIPDALLESELFGHEKGAFTGASEQRVGRFEEAGSGTIFLDEIGEMGYSMQSKLLKVLQDQKFSRVGGNKLISCNARVIAATNRDLESEVAQGRFRSDLFYRLQVMTLVIPPLRKRPGDVPLLARHFLAKFSKGRDIQLEFAPETLQLMMRYHWPGNVRELENLVERLAVLCTTSPILPDQLPERLTHGLGVLPAPSNSGLSNAYEGTFKEAKTRFEVAYLKELLGKAGGNMAEAARLAGLDRSQFFRMVKRHRIDPRVYANAPASERWPLANAR